MKTRRFANRYANRSGGAHRRSVTKNSYCHTFAALHMLSVAVPAAHSNSLVRRQGTSEDEQCNSGRRQESHADKPENQQGTYSGHRTPIFSWPPAALPEHYTRHQTLKVLLKSEAAMLKQAATLTSRSTLSVHAYRDPT